MGMYIILRGLYNKYRVDIMLAKIKVMTSKENGNKSPPKKVRNIITRKVIRHLCQQFTSCNYLNCVTLTF